jgi:hypothetical protein
MKYINLDPRTSVFLQQWAGSRKLLISAFYFWHLGTGLQKSQNGLLRSLLHDILELNRDLIPETMPDLCRDIIKYRGQIVDEPTIPELMRWLRNLLRHIEGRHCICFMIDGLIDYYADYDDLLGLIQ